VLAGCQFGVSLDALQAGGPAGGSGADAALDHLDPSVTDSAQSGDSRSDATPPNGIDSADRPDVRPISADAGEPEDGSRESSGDAASTGFPGTSSRLLDDFSSASGMLGPQWTGDVMSFVVKGGGLAVTSGLCNAVLQWVSNLRSPPQEAYFRVLAVAPG